MNLKFNYNIIAQFSSIPLFLLLWQWVSDAEIVNPLLFPPPTRVAEAFYRWATDGPLVMDAAMSVSRVVVGFTLGSVVGIIVGILTGRYQLVASFLTPIFGILRPIPPIAFVPLVILWFGLSEGGKYFLIFWGVFFTVWIATHLGVQRVDQTYIRAARCLGTPEHRMLSQVLFPGSLPFIFVGLRTSVSIAFYTLVAAELAGAFSGVVYRIDIAQQNLQIGQVMAGLLILGFMSAIADKLFSVITQRIGWWE
jgi:ABC-type nitrate/sulfonate/bicarbonate transport system permease component